VGRKPIPIPDGVEIVVEGNSVWVKGPNGELVQTFHPEMQVLVEEGKVYVKRPSEKNFHKSLHGLTRTLIANAISGVTKGFKKVLEIVGVGYRAEMKGNSLSLQLGYSHPVLFSKPPGIDFEVIDQTKIVVKGIDKELVGVVAATIRHFRPAEPYKGKGIKYEGEKVRRKAGKAATGVTG